MNDALFELLGQEQELLDAVLATQQEIRSLVRDKDWPMLESALHRFAGLSAEFNALDARRSQSVEGDFFVYLNSLAGDEKRAMTARFFELRRALARSRAENKALNDYLRIMQDFLHGIFERVIPNRRAKVYTAAGIIANPMPTRLVVDCRG
jgi:hypothetical protein